MISLLKTVTDLDRLDDLQRTALECYALSIAATAQYAVTVDQGEADKFRESLQSLEKQLRGNASPEVARQVESAVRGGLRAYQDKSQKVIDQLHKDVSAAAVAMKVFAESVTSNSADHEKQVEGEIKVLKTLTNSDDITEIKGGIQHSTSTIEASFEQLRRSNQLVIAQLQDEIRTLHKTIETEKRHTVEVEKRVVATADQHATVWPQNKMSAKMEELLASNQKFSVLLVHVRNLNRLNTRHSGPLVEDAMKTAMGRFQKMFGEDVAGRWTNDEFLAVLAGPVDAVAVPRDATQKLSGDYVVFELGAPQDISLQFTAGLVERRQGDDREKFAKSLDQIALVLARP